MKLQQCPHTHHAGRDVVGGLTRSPSKMELLSHLGAEPVLLFSYETLRRQPHEKMWRATELLLHERALAHADILQQEPFAD